MDIDLGFFRQYLADSGPIYKDFTFPAAPINIILDIDVQFFRKYTD